MLSARGLRYNLFSYWAFIFGFKSKNLFFKKKVDKKKKNIFQKMGILWGVLKKTGDGLYVTFFAFTLYFYVSCVHHFLHFR